MPSLRALPKELPVDRAALVDTLARLYTAYVENDAELMEINPLVVTRGRQARRARLQVRDG